MVAEKTVCRLCLSAIDAPERGLFNAMLQITGTGAGPKVQVPSMGSSVKWRQISSVRLLIAVYIVTLDNY